MATNIAQINSTPQITDFFRNENVNCFCACGKIDLNGVCLPDNSAPAPVVAVIDGWTVAIIDVRSGRTIEALFRCESPCIAVAMLHEVSAARRLPIDVDFFTNALTPADWGKLISRESSRLFTAGIEAAAALDGIDAEPVRPEAATPEEWEIVKAVWYAKCEAWQAWQLVRQLPIAQAGWASATAPVAWDAAFFDAHQSAEVA